MAAQPIRNKDELRKFIAYYYDKKHWRNHALIVVGLNTALRISDLLRIRWEQVYDATARRFRTHLHLTERKTKKAQIIILNREVIYALTLHLASNPDVADTDFVFTNNRRGELANALCRQQAHRIIKEAASHIQTTEKISSHTLRKTFGYHAWRAGVAVPVLMDIYNHCNYLVTRRYLGITQDDKDKVFLQLQNMGDLPQTPPVF